MLKYLQDWWYGWSHWERLEVFGEFRLPKEGEPEFGIPRPPKGIEITVDTTGWVVITFWIKSWEDGKRKQFMDFSSQLEAQDQFNLYKYIPFHGGY